MFLAGMLPFSPWRILALQPGGCALRASRNPWGRSARRAPFLKTASLGSAGNSFGAQRQAWAGASFRPQAWDRSPEAKFDISGWENVEPGRPLSTWFEILGRFAVHVPILFVLLAFMRWAETHYRTPDGEPTTDICELKWSIRPGRELYGHTPVVEFGPRARSRAPAHDWAEVVPRAGSRCVRHSWSLCRGLPAVFAGRPPSGLGRVHAREEPVSVRSGRSASRSGMRSRSLRAVLPASANCYRGTIANTAVAPKTLGDSRIGATTFP